ncbi:MAG: hypothetical protein AAFO07_34215, partial [Bacteroidota bacterium]
SILLFILLRIGNFYGDPAPWSLQEEAIYSFLSFINLTKYPISLQYALVMLGIGMLILYAAEKIKPTGLNSVVITFGRVPLFFYLLHLYIIHAFAFIGVAIDNLPLDIMIITPKTFQEQTLVDYGFNLLVVYAVSVLVLAILYPICRWYMKYKAENKNKWWLSYL